MKRMLSRYVPLLLIVLGLSGCLEDKCEQMITYYSYQPVYQSMEQIRAAVAVEAARDLDRPGKMYIKDGILFISEINEGIHVIDNTDPTQPQPLAFINVPGNHDIAAKGNVLYADSYMDLVAIDISQPAQAQEIGREQEVFPYGSWHNGLWADPDSGIAVDWIEHEITEEMACSDVGGGIGIGLGLNMFAMEDALMSGAPRAASNSSLNPAPGAQSAATAGVGGSMARFTILNQYLYTVTFSDLIVFDIANLADPNEVNRMNVGWDIETIFPRGNTLFLGSQTGMHIYSVAAPTQPQFLSMIQHVQACDPVVADEEYAYVTIRDGNDCGGSVNELFIVDLQDLSNPIRIHTYSMHNPHGLGISGETLFVCDGDEGLKVYDATDVGAITANELAHFPDLHAYDVIPLGNVVMTIGEDGFYQYDFSDLSNISLLSFLPVGQ